WDQQRPMGIIHLEMEVWLAAGGHIPCRAYPSNHVPGRDASAFLGKQGPIKVHVTAGGSVRMTDSDLVALVGVSPPTKFNLAEVHRMNPRPNWGWDVDSLMEPAPVSA